jgi:hypothetical protein
MGKTIQDFLMESGAKYSSLLGECYETFVSDVLEGNYDLALELLLTCSSEKAVEAEKVISLL